MDEQGKLSNSERFLNAYSAIEHEMERILDLKDHRRFFELIDKSARINPIIERFKFDLREFGELRNAIVHDRAGGEIIAEPNDQAVAQIERIAHLLLEPPGVAPDFLKEVLTLKVSDPVSRAIRELSNFSYTQAPVLDDGKLAGMVTSNMIVKWMGKSLADGTFNINKTTLQDVIRVVGHENNYITVSVNKSLFEIPELFYKWQQDGKKLEAVLITQHGRLDEKLLGIITNRDLPAVHRELENKW
ncbi:MAG: CBS domain-containing protein [Bacillota bacterium]|nr:CBS domain-containing protein [Bacillota bacterium]